MHVLFLAALLASHLPATAAPLAGTAAAHGADTHPAPAASTPPAAVPRPGADSASAPRLDASAANVPAPRPDVSPATLLASNSAAHGADTHPGAVASTPPAGAPRLGADSASARRPNASTANPPAPRPDAAAASEEGPATPEAGADTPATDSPAHDPDPAAATQAAPAPRPVAATATEAAPTAPAAATEAAPTAAATPIPAVEAPAPDSAWLRFAARQAVDADAAEYRARAEAEAEAYHLRAEVHAALLPAVQRWPGRVRVQRVGTSVEGRPLWLFRVADPTVPVRHKLLVFANIHALEWISTEVALAFLLDTIERPPPGVEVAVLPILNPDGRMKAEADLREGRDRAYRRGNGNTVDLNRDFAVNRDPPSIWRAVIPGRYEVSPAPLSQPEAQALDALAAEGWDAAISLHAFGGFHFLPWAGRWQRPDDWAALHALGRTMQAGQGRGAYKVMQLSRYIFAFRGCGMEVDHLYGAHGIPSVLVELTRSGITGPRDLKTPFRWYNPRRPAHHVESGAGALRAVAWALSQAATSGEPVPWSSAP